MHFSFSIAQWASYISSQSSGVLVYIFLIGSIFSLPFHVYVLTFEVLFFMSDWLSIGMNVVVHSP